MITVCLDDCKLVVHFSCCLLEIVDLKNNFGTFHNIQERKKKKNQTEKEEQMQRLTEVQRTFLTETKNTEVFYLVVFFA